MFATISILLFKLRPRLILLSTTNVRPSNPEENSATFSNEIRKLGRSYLNHPVEIEVAARNATANTITQIAYKMSGDQKRAAVVHLVKSRGLKQVIVFSNTKIGTARLARELERDGVKAESIHGDKTQADRMKALEAFKAGNYDFHLENTAKVWATQFDIPQVRDGRIIKTELPDDNPTGMQGFAYNLRRPQFRDRIVRQALAYAFDFEWSNKALFFGQYARTKSYFSNSDFASRGLPEGDSVLSLTPGNVVAPRGAAVLRITPARLYVSVVRAVEETVRVAPQVQGTPAEGFVVGRVAAEPPQIRIKGPQFTIEGRDEVMTTPVDVSGMRETIVRSVGLALPDSAYVSGEQTVNVTLGEFPREQQAASRGERREDGRRGQTDVPRLGLTLAPADSVGGAGGEGVVVTDVQDGSPAAETGFRTGDVILDVGGKSVKSPSDAAMLSMRAMALTMA